VKCLERFLRECVPLGAANFSPPVKVVFLGRFCPCTPVVSIASLGDEKQLVFEEFQHLPLLYGSAGGSMAKPPWTRDPPPTAFAW
jgi:hypothetical protein